MGKGSVLFWGEISPNFDLNNMISNYAKDFSRKKKVPNSPDFEGKNIPNCQILRISSSRFPRILKHSACFFLKNFNI
jgi:hypothetical protein